MFNETVFDLFIHRFLFKNNIFLWHWASVCFFYRTLSPALEKTCFHGSMWLAYGDLMLSACKGSSKLQPLFSFYAGPLLWKGIWLIKITLNLHRSICCITATKTNVGANNANNVNGNWTVQRPISLVWCSCFCHCLVKYVKSLNIVWTALENKKTYWCHWQFIFHRLLQWPWQQHVLL